ncbi:hypothetical protein [Alteromonas sp. KS69]|nr:hypothetical protein [Alteromonas sp. KS69]
MPPQQRHEYQHLTQNHGAGKISVVEKMLHSRNTFLLTKQIVGTCG